MKIRYGVLVVSCLLFAGCARLKTPLRKNLVHLSAPCKIGTYPVKVDRVITENGKVLNWSEVIWHHFKSSSDPDSLALNQATHIVLELIDDKHLSAGLYHNDRLIKENMIKGRLKDGYFRRKSRLSLKGIPPIYWSVTSSKVQFGLGKQKELYIDHASEANGGFLIMVAGTPGLTRSLIVPSLK